MTSIWTEKDGTKVSLDFADGFIWVYYRTDETTRCKPIADGDRLSENFSTKQTIKICSVLIENNIATADNGLLHFFNNRNLKI